MWSGAPARGVRKHSVTPSVNFDMRWTTIWMIRILSSPMFRAVAAMALGLELSFVHTWLHVSEFTSRWFSDRGRAATLPMVKGVSDLSAAQFSGADYF